MKLWLVRHAAPIVPPGVCYGASDIAADAEATQLAAQALANAVPHGIDVSVSPLQRCEQLRSEIPGLRADLTFKTDAALAEFDFGAWELRSWSDIGEASLAAWTADFAHHRPGGGECVADFMARIASTFDRTVVAGRDTAWITHAGVIRAATLLARGIRGIDRAADWPQAVPAYGEWVVVEITSARPLLSY